MNDIRIVLESKFKLPKGDYLNYKDVFGFHIWYSPNMVLTDASDQIGKKPLEDLAQEIASYANKHSYSEIELGKKGVLVQGKIKPNGMFDQISLVTVGLDTDLGVQDVTFEELESIILESEVLAFVGDKIKGKNENYGIVNEGEF